MTMTMVMMMMMMVDGGNSQVSLVAAVLCRSGAAPPQLDRGITDPASAIAGAL